MRYEIPATARNWPVDLAKAMNDANDGDTIVVSNDKRAALAEREWVRT